MLFGWGKKKKAEEQATQRPANIHPQSKQLSTKGGKISQVKPKQKQDASGLSKEDIIEIRTAEFKVIGIPFNEVAEVESNKIYPTKISPEVIINQTEVANNILKNMGFMFRIDEHEYFICDVEFMKHKNKVLEEHRKGNFIPQYFFMDFVLSRRAEKVILNKMGLKDKPITGQVAEIFFKESSSLYKRFCEDVKQFELRREATRRLQREKGVKSEELPDENEIKLMIVKIQRERSTAKDRQSLR